MRSIDTWVVFLHVLGAFGFVLAHGTTAFVAFRVGAEREPQRLAPLLDLSALTMGPMYRSLAILVAAGVAAGIMGAWFGQLWIWSALVVLVAVALAMLVFGSRYYNHVRHALRSPPGAARRPTRRPRPPSWGGCWTRGARRRSRQWAGRARAAPAADGVQALLRRGPAGQLGMRKGSGWLPSRSVKP